VLLPGRSHYAIVFGIAIWLHGFLFVHGALLGLAAMDGLATRAGGVDPAAVAAWPSGVFRAAGRGWPCFAAGAGEVPRPADVFGAGLSLSMPLPLYMLVSVFVLVSVLESVPVSVLVSVLVSVYVAVSLLL
jgi:hypothetical protein